VSMLHSCHFGPCTHHETDRNPKFQLCSRCNRVRYCCRECQKADWASHKRMCSIADPSMNVSKSQTRTKETITSQWFNENVAFVLGTADARGIPRSKLVLYLDFTRAGADGKIPLLEVMPDSTALSSLKVLGMHGNAPWWNAEQRDNIAMYFEKRKDAFANGFKGLQIVHACRFETSVYAGRWMVVEEAMLAGIESRVAWARK